MAADQNVHSLQGIHCKMIPQSHVIQKSKLDIIIQESDLFTGLESGQANVWTSIASKRISKGTYDC